MRYFWGKSISQDCTLIVCMRVSALFNSAICSAISWWEQINFQWDDDDVRFVLDNTPSWNFYCASSLKQHSADSHVAPLRHVILIQSQPVFALSPYCFGLSWEATHTNFIVFGLIRWGSNPRSTVLEVSTLTITPPMRSNEERFGMWLNSDDNYWNISVVICDTYIP
jgi:hypothetical protein